MLHFLWRVKVPLVLAIFVIAASSLAAVFLMFNPSSLAQLVSRESPITETTSFVAEILPPAPRMLNPPAIVEAKNGLIQNGSKFIEADLSQMKLRVWEAGQVVKEVPILTIGRVGSWWETPTGIYRIESKARTHFSSFGGVYQPWSMAFQGNFFIHGWPYYPNGKDVASTYSGGCIRLSTADAKEIYNLVEINTPVLVSNADLVEGDEFTYSTARHLFPEASASAFLAADLKNRFILAEKGNTEIALPIASITKLVTALVAAEYINLDKKITVSARAIVPTSLPRLKAGQKYSAYQLLYPLLTESSNEAAFALADYLGRERFVELMNEKAEALGMVNTYFVDPAGMGAQNVSSPADLFALAQYLLDNRSFVLKITSGTLGPNVYGPSEFKDLKNFNAFVGDPNFLGGKVGKSIEAKETVLAIFEEELEGAKRPLVIIVLGSANKEQDARVIRDAILEEYRK